MRNVEHTVAFSLINGSNDVDRPNIYTRALCNKSTGGTLDHQIEYVLYVNGETVKVC